MATNKKPAMIEMTAEEVKALQERIQNKQLREEDYSILGQTVQFVLWVQIQLLHAKITMHKFKKMLFGSKSEKRKDKDKNDRKEKPAHSDLSESEEVTPHEDQKKETTDLAVNSEIPLDNPGASTNQEEPKKKVKGHGRMAANEYEPDEVIVVKHETLKPGDNCPTECGGRLYELPVTPGGIIRVQGQSCAHVVSYEFYRLRCALCGEIFTPEAPPDFSLEKYDEYFKSILVVQKYYVATPFHRQERYQSLLNFYLPDATQWDCVESVANDVYPAFYALEEVGANYPNASHDDSYVKILSVMRDNQLNPDKERVGMYTTCVIAQADEGEICLYYHGVKHGGENMGSLLEKRDPTLPPVIRMCDALAANTPKNFKTILCNCLSHGRRKFTEIEAFFPEECEQIIEQLSLIYQYDAETKNMSKEERLLYHQENSAPIMTALHQWMQAQIDEKKVEPNSALGGAIRYMLKHWSALTRFLTVAGALIDNNHVERALKLAIRTRKNALFFKTEHGAFVGALLLSLIATCERAGKNPVVYLTTLQKNKTALFQSPHLWLPWNFEATLADTEKIIQPQAA